MKLSPRKFYRWKCWCKSKTDGKGRMFARKRELKDDMELGSTVIVGVVVELWKQRCMCYLNALYIKKKEKDLEGLYDTRRIWNG